MYNLLFRRSNSSNVPSGNTSDIEDRLQELHVAPPSPSIMRGDFYNCVTQTSEHSNAIMDMPFRLLDLPPELIDRVLYFLNAISLAQVAQTCRTLHNYAYDERNWLSITQGLQLPTAHELPSPFSNWREFYSSHYPYWFLPKYKVWFADRATREHSLTGQFTLARYDYRMGNIEVYRLFAENTSIASFEWLWNPGVTIHEFKPRIRMLIDDPIVKLEVGMYEKGGRLKKEVSLTRGYERYQIGLRSRLFLTRPVPPMAQVPSMALWPPKIMPAENRVRSESSTLFKDKGHKPSRHEELSETTFRTRLWTEFTGFAGGLGAKMGEDVTTFSTLPFSCYTPTKEKPYQGIWVGDYSGHGCEFLLITQKTIDEAAGITPITPMSEEAREEMFSQYRQGNSPRVTEPEQSEQSDPPGCSGRLEAIKLTGDVNVPKGEYTFVAEDIGRKGFIRVAREQPFQGARVVKCWGHVACRGYIDEGYIPSQLIMISHDCLAQYWEEFGHISFFKRLDIDKFLDVETAPIEGLFL